MLGTKEMKGKGMNAPKAIFKNKVITKTPKGFCVEGKAYLTLGQATAAIK